MLIEFAHLGVIDLPTIQKKLNFHFSLSLDLFGQEMSTNAANAFNAGIKGRYMESKLEDDQSAGWRYLFREDSQGWKDCG